MPRHPYDQEPEPPGGRALERLQDTLERRYPGGVLPADEGEPPASREEREQGEAREQGEEPPAQGEFADDEEDSIDDESSFDDEPAAYYPGSG